MALLAVAACASAGQAADSYYFFGDSLTDEGRGGRTAPVMWTDVLRTDTTVVQGANFAIGGATTGHQASLVFGDSGYLGQIGSFVASAPVISPDATAGIWIGTNNIQIGAAQGQSPTVIAQTAIGDIRNGIQQLVAQGVNNFVVLGVYDLSLTNALGPADATSLVTRLAAAGASQQLNAQIAAMSVPGATIRYFDIAAFINHLQMNPQLYGFQQILPLQPGSTCNASCQQTSIFSDQIHLSSKTQTLIGDYIAGANPQYNATFNSYGVIFENVASSSASLQAPAPLATAAAAGFVSMMFDRLDASRALGAHNARAQAAGVGTPPVGRWSTFVQGDVAGGRILDARIPTNQSDLTFTASGQTAGLQYDLAPDALIGFALNHTYLTGNLGSTINTSTRFDSFQAAVFASLGDSARFLDGILVVSSHEGSQTRSGSFGTLQSDQKARSFTAAARAGFLLPIGPVRVGPITGVSFSRTWIDGYQERGGSSGLFAMGVAGHTSDSLVGSAGLQFRASAMWAWRFDPFLNVTYERQILTSNPDITSFLVSLPTQQFQTTPALSSNAVRVATGVYLGGAEGWSGIVAAYGMIGEQGTYVAGASTGLKYHF